MVPGLLVLLPPEPPVPDVLLPEVVVPELLPPELPPPQPAATPPMIIHSTRNTVATLSFRVRTFSNRKEHASKLMAVSKSIQSRSRGPIAGARSREWAVVVIVSILWPLLPLPVRLTVEFVAPFSVNEQPGVCRSAGFVGFTAHVRETIPLSPMEVTVMGLVADWPAVGIKMQGPPNP